MRYIPQLRSSSRLCRDLAALKADELMLHGNPITTDSKYPECLEPILKNFKKIVSNIFKHKQRCDNYL